MHKKIGELNPEEVGILLRLNYFKIGLELNQGSLEENALVKEIMSYQKNLWVYSFNDMFSKFAAGVIKGQENLQPVFTGYFVSQLRKAFFETIESYQKKKAQERPPRYTYRYRKHNHIRSREGNSCKSMAELVRAAL